MALPIPFAKDNTVVVNPPRSTSQIRELYSFFLLMLSVYGLEVGGTVGRCVWVKYLCVEMASCDVFQKSPARMSTRTPSLMLAEKKKQVLWAEWF